MKWLAVGLEGTEQYGPVQVKVSILERRLSMTFRHDAIGKKDRFLRQFTFTYDSHWSPDDSGEARRVAEAIAEPLARALASVYSPKPGALSLAPLDGRGGLSSP